MSAAWWSRRRREIERAGLQHLDEHPDDTWCTGEMSDPSAGWAVPRSTSWYRTRKTAIEVAALDVLSRPVDKTDRHDQWTRWWARRAIDSPDADVAEAAMAEGIGNLSTKERVRMLADVEARLASISNTSE